MSLAAQIIPASTRGKTVFGTICGPIHHKDESEEYNDQRLVRRLESILREIDRLEEESRAAYIQAAYHTSHTLSGDRCQTLARHLEDNVSRLRAEFDQVRALLLTRRPGWTSVTMGCFESCAHASERRRNHPFNYYEICWALRLLKLSETSDLVTIDDLRVALPERVFRGDSFLRILSLLDFLGLDLEIDGPDKFSLRDVLKFAYQKAEPTVENVSGALQKLSVIRVKLKELVICDEESISQTIKFLNGIVDGKLTPEDALMSPAPIRGACSWTALLDLVSALRRSQIKKPLRGGPEGRLKDYRRHVQKLLRQVYDSLGFRPSAIESIAKAIIRRRTNPIASLLRQGQTIEQDIVEMHLRVILTTCPSYVGNGLELADLFQEGCQGVMRALDRFDPKRDCVFRNYAAFWIHQAVTHAVAMKGRLIRIPVYLLERLAKLEDVKKSNDIPNHPALLSQLYTNAESENALQLLRMAEPELLRIEDVAESELLKATAPDEREIPTEGNCDLQLQEVLLQVLETLDPREKNVVMLRFGLSGFEAQTLQEIGDKYGLTRERIRQIEVSALKKLRHSSWTSVLRDVCGFG